MNRSDQDKLIWYALTIPTIIGNYYLHKSVGMLDLFSTEYGLTIILFYIAVTGFAFARMIVFLIRLCPLLIELPFALHYEKKQGDERK